MSHFIKAIVLTVSGCLLVMPLFAKDTHPEQVGFWWYQSIDEDESESEEIEELPKPAPLPERGELMKMPPSQIKRMMQERLDYALYAKTPEATLDYMVLKDIARRNARIHASLTGFVMAKNPELNPRAQYPITNMGISARKAYASQTVKQRLDSARDRYALILLSDPSCRYCSVQRQLLHTFARLHGWQVKEVDITQQPEIAAFFNVELTPTTVLIKNGSEQWQPVAVGIESVASIERQLSSVLRWWEGEIQLEQFYTQEQDQGGYFDPLSFMPIEEEVPSEP